MLNNLKNCNISPHLLSIGFRKRQLQYSNVKMFVVINKAKNRSSKNVKNEGSRI